MECGHELDVLDRAAHIVVLYNTGTVFLPASRRSRPLRLLPVALADGLADDNDDDDNHDPRLPKARITQSPGHDVLAKGSTRFTAMVGNTEGSFLVCFWS